MSITSRSQSNPPDHHRCNPDTAKFAWLQIRALTAAPDIIAAEHKLMYDIGLSSGPIRALRALLALGPKPMRDLAEYLGCNKSYVTTLVRPLIVKELATLESDPSDGRIKIVALTERGIHTAKQAQRTYETPPAAIARLSDDELEVLADALRNIGDMKHP